MNHYTQLTMEDRCKFRVLLDMNIPIAIIARRMGFHRSTLYRELKRNQSKSRYQAALAHHQAMSRKRRKCYIQLNSTLREYVVRHIKNGWSPEQIVGRLKRKKSKYVICHETIYRYIYNHNQKLYKYLAYKKPRRLKPHVRKPQSCRFGEKRLITERSERINLRNQVSHWEGDLIEFKGNKLQSVTTLVERKTRMLFLIKNETKDSQSVMAKIQEKLSALSQSICKTITFDQGSEFARFELLEQPLNSQVFYCHKHSPWEKGSNENMNGRLRWRDLPKDLDITQITQEQLDEIAKKMNATPRKCLDYRMPKELFLRCFTQICRTSV